MGLSEAAFSRFFKKSTGWSFIGYVNEVRIRAASLLLCETEDAPVQQNTQQSESVFQNKPMPADG